MIAYATPDEYRALYPETQLTDEQIKRAVDTATFSIDTMTFCRIRQVGFDKLTDMQREIVTRATCMQANFDITYGEMLSNPLASYSINGVSMSWDSANILTNNGVQTSNDVVNLLNQTGLTYRGLDWMG